MMTTSDKIQVQALMDDTRFHEEGELFPVAVAFMDSTFLKSNPRISFYACLSVFVTGLSFAKCQQEDRF